MKFLPLRPEVMLVANLTLKMSAAFAYFFNLDFSAAEESSNCDALTSDQIEALKAKSEELKISADDISVDEDGTAFVAFARVFSG